MASAQTARARQTSAADYHAQNAASRSPAGLNGQPIRGRASLAQRLGPPCACVIFDPWQRSKTRGGGKNTALRTRDE